MCGRALVSVLLAALVVLPSPGGVNRRTFTDHIGRRVELNAEPRRVVSLAPSITETLFALGLGDRVAGVTDYCDYPAAALTRPKVGGIINPSVEAIVALQPDLVLVGRETNRRETVEALDRLRVPVYVLNAERLEDVFRMVRDVADLAGVAPRGERLARGLERRSARVERLVSREAPVRVFFLVGLNPVVTVGRSSFLDDLVRRAGGQSISNASAQPWPRFSVEEILRDDPQFLLVARSPGFAPRREDLLRWPGWSELKAVHDDHIIYLPSEVERPGPRLVEMQELIARALHPGVFVSTSR
jgi:iron complex transport system substrate-binding protein